MKRSFLFLSIVFAMWCKAYGQTNFYVELSGNYSLISKSEYVDYLSTPIGAIPLKMPFGITENYDGKVGGDLGFGFDKKVQDRVWVNSGLGLSYHQFKKKTKVNAINPLEGTKFSDMIAIEDLQIKEQDLEGNNLGDTKALYASVPVRVKYEVVPNLFRVGVGVTNYFMLYSNQTKLDIAITEKGPVINEYKNTSKNDFNNYQLNGNIQLEYKIVKSFWLQANYNHGFFNIYDDSQKSISKYRTITLGLKYDL